MATKVLLLAGLPGVGKSRLAEALAGPLDAVVLNRDAIRDGLVPERFLDYGDEQNEIATTAMLAVLDHLVRRRVPGWIVLDGKPFSRASEIGRVRAIVERAGASMTIVHCIAPPEVVARRLEADLARDPRNRRAARTPDKAARIRRAFEPIDGAHLTVDTSGPLDDVARRCLAALGHGVAPAGADPTGGSHP
jgi:predicted kinase